MKVPNAVDEILEEATNSLVDADRLALALPAEYQPTVRALISGMVGLVEAVAESHRDLVSRIESKAAPTPIERAPSPLLILGME